VLCHGLAACGDDFSIHGFTSRRRHRVEVNTIKGFDENVNEKVRRRIQALKPGHYTRMGTATRHVTKELAARGNRNRLLLVLTDGKPNDTDYYEGRYALEDTRRAVLEARRQDIRTFGITIDHEARPISLGYSGVAPTTSCSAESLVKRCPVSTNSLQDSDHGPVPRTPPCNTRLSIAAARWLRTTRSGRSRLLRARTNRRRRHDP